MHEALELPPGIVGYPVVPDQQFGLALGLEPHGDGAGPFLGGEPSRRLPGVHSPEPVAAGKPDDQGRVDVLYRPLEPEDDPVPLGHLGRRQVAPVGRGEDQLNAVLSRLAKHQFVQEKLLQGGEHEQALLQSVVAPVRRPGPGSRRSPPWSPGCFPARPARPGRRSPSRQRRRRAVRAAAARSRRTSAASPVRRTPSGRCTPRRPRSARRRRAPAG